jgi:hypothetical protein
VWQAFVHVSTAYSNSIHKDIQEKVYPPPMNPDVLDKMPEKYLIANEKTYSSYFGVKNI